MPWKECHVVDERARFVARLMDGETMTALCEEFGISRKTGYRSPSGSSSLACGASAIGADGLIGTPISCRWPSKR